MAYQSKNFLTPFETFLELGRQDAFEYGTVAETSIINYIEKKSAVDGQWKRMHAIIKKNTVNTSSQGYEWVGSRDNWAFLWDVAGIDYKIRNNCTFATIQDSIFHKGYGFAVRKNRDTMSIKRNPVREQLSMGVLELEDDGTMEKLREAKL